MRGLFLAEGVHGLDPLELGRVEGGSIGPVVFRLLDADGRLTGSLAAASMRLEASYAARSVTLVLSDGHESRGGERHPFTNGERRIPLRPIAWGRAQLGERQPCGPCCRNAAGELSTCGTLSTLRAR